MLRDGSDSHRCDVCFQFKPDALKLPVMQQAGNVRTMWVCGACAEKMAHLEQCEGRDDA